MNCADTRFQTREASVSTGRPSTQSSRSSPALCVAKRAPGDEPVCFLLCCVPYSSCFARTRKWSPLLPIIVFPQHSSKIKGFASTYISARESSPSCVNCALSTNMRKTKSSFKMSVPDFAKTNRAYSLTIEGQQQLVSQMIGLTDFAFVSERTTCEFT